LELFFDPQERKRNAKRGKLGEQMAKRFLKKRNSCIRMWEEARRQRESRGESEEDGEAGGQEKNWCIVGGRYTDECIPEGVRLLYPTMDKLCRYGS
jgi:hypothetical protein